MSAHRLEVAVHLGSFTNLELLRKGLFRVRVRAYVQDPAAPPTSVVNGAVVASQAAPRRLYSRARLITNCEGSTAGVDAAYIDDDSACFSTRSVYCRYIEESFDINEVCIFKVVLAPGRPSPTDRLYVEAQLLRADFGAPAGSPPEAPPSVRTSAYEVVSTRCLDVGLVASAHLHAYFPVVWDSLNLALADMTVRAATVAALFEPPPRVGACDQLYLETVLLPKLLIESRGGAGMSAVVAPPAAAAASSAPQSQASRGNGGAALGQQRRGGLSLGFGDKLKGWVSSALSISPTLPPAPAPRAPAPRAAGAPKEMEVRPVSSAASSDAEDATVSMSLSAFTGDMAGAAQARGHAAPEKMLPRREVASLALPYSLAEAAFPRWRAAQARDRLHARLQQYLREAGMLPQAAAAAPAFAPSVAPGEGSFPLSPAELQRAHVAVVRPLVDTYLGLVVVADELAALQAAVETGSGRESQPSFHLTHAAAAIESERFCEYVLDLCDEMLGPAGKATAAGGGDPLAAKPSSSPRLAVGLGLSVEAAAAAGPAVRPAPSAGAGLSHRVAALLSEVACHTRYQRDGKSYLGTGPAPQGRCKGGASGEDGKSEEGGKGADSEEEKEGLPTGHAPVVPLLAGPASPGGGGAGKSPASAASGAGSALSAGSATDGTGTVDGYGVAYQGRSGGGDTATLDECFAARVRAAAECPEAVGVALANEAEHVSGAIYAVWRRLIKLTLGAPTVAPLTAAAAYRAAVLSSLRSHMTQTTSLPSAVYDPRSKPLPEPPLGHRATWATAAARCRGVRLDPVHAGLPNDVSIHEHRYTALLRGEDDTGAIGHAEGPKPKGKAKGKGVTAAPAAAAAASRVARLGSDAAFSDDDGGNLSSGSEGDAGAGAAASGGGGDRRVPPLGLPLPAPPVAAAPLPHTSSSGSLSSSARGGAGGDAVLSILPTLDSLRPLSSSRKAHVVIFMNGLGGSVHDTRLMRAHFKALHPHLVCHALAGNQGKSSEGDIIATAARLAEETHEFLSTRLAEDGAQLARLSFVAFSLGGVIARLMLRHPLLVPYRPRFHAFVTVASPHLGLLYARSAILNAGVYLFKAVKGSQAMAQLSFSDEKPPPQNGGGDGLAYPAVSAGGVGVRRCLLYLLACGWQPPPAALLKQPGRASGGSAAELQGPALPPASTARGAAAGSGGGQPTGAAAVAALAAAAAGNDGDGDIHRMALLKVHAGSGGSRHLGDAAPAADAHPTGRAALQAVLASTAAPGAGNDRVPLLGLFETAELPDVEQGRRRSGGEASRSSASTPPTKMTVTQAGGAGEAPGLGTAAGAAAAAPLDAAEPAPESTTAQPPSDPAVSTRTLAALAAHRFAWQPNGQVLSPFRHVVLVASAQDAYAPAHSCFAQWGDAALADAKNGPAWGEMVRGFYTGLPSVSVLRRWEVAFQSLGGGMSVDAMLGREAHIAFLENEHFGAALAAGLQDVWDVRA